LPREHAGVEEAIKKVEELHRKFKGNIVPGQVKFHAMDLSDVNGLVASTEALKKEISSAHDGRLDIVNCNAGIACTSAKLTVDGNDQTFGVNCLGHFTFLNTILGFLKTSADTFGPVRITVTSSTGYKAASPELDYDMFTTSIDEVSKTKRGGMLEGVKRYLNSKCGVLYIAMELNRQLHEEGVNNIIVNAVHPGKKVCCTSTSG